MCDSDDESAVLDLHFGRDLLQPYIYDKSILLYSRKSLMADLGNLGRA